MSTLTIMDFLISSDPLSKEATNLLLTHQEEDILVDYKEDFDFDNEKEWLGLTVDAMAFANTLGGYIVFGVQDGTFELVGISGRVAKVTANVDLVLQKFNRYIAPPFTEIRTKRTRRNGKTYVILHVPESKGKTHIVVKQANYRHPSSRKTITVLSPGMIYVRRSGGNQIIDPEGLASIIDRRIEHFKSSLFDKIARVVQSSPEHQVLIYDPTASEENGDKFVISDAPDAIPIKGMSFSTSPETEEQTVASWIALAKNDPNFQPPVQSLWRLYSERHNLNLTVSQLEAMAKFCILNEVPSFFWLQKAKSKKLRKLLNELIQTTTGPSAKTYVLHIGAFLGRSCYAELLRKLGDMAKRLSERSRKYPVSGPRGFFSPEFIELRHRREKGFKKSKSAFRGFLEEKLDNLAQDFSQGRGGVLERKEAQDIDCYLYARDDEYKHTKAT